MSGLRRVIARCAVAVLLVAAAADARAAWKENGLENVLASERQRAIAESGRIAASRAEIQAEAQQTASAAADEMRAAKAHLADLQNELVSALTKDEPGVLKAVQAEIAAWQTRVEAADAEQALALKRAEELDRETDAWKQRAATLELALRLEMRTLLATRSEVEGRDRKVENARKDIEYQQSQVRKYVSRRENAGLKWQEYRDRFVAATVRARQARPALPSNPAQERLAAALAEEMRQLQRGMRFQQGWFLLNKTLEDHAWRNLAFARTDLAVNETYAAALARKELQQHATEANVLADQADATLSIARAAVESRMATVGQEMTAAGKAADAALAAIGAAPDDRAQEAAHADYTLALERRSRWEAESEFLKEFISYQKAVAAFAREKADRARSAAEAKALQEIAQERDALRESARTSEQYVVSFKSMLQKLDGQIEAARRSTALGEAEAASLREQVREVATRLAADRPQAPQVLCGRLLVAADRATRSGAENAEQRRRRQAAATQFTFRVAQRALAQERLTIAEKWLESTRNAIQALDQTASNLLWKQSDPRLTWGSALELGGCLAAAASDGGFIVDTYQIGLAGKQGYASGWRIAMGSSLVLLLMAVGIWLRFRLHPFAGRAGYWLAGHAAPILPAAAASGVFLLAYFPHNRFALLLGLGLPLAGLAHLGWGSLTVLCPGHRCPPLQILGGAALAAVRLLLISGTVVLTLALFCRRAENRWDVEYLLLHVWLFFVCLAVFRLGLHPLLLGRFLSRRSAHRGIRILGAGVAFACVAATGLLAVLYLFSLDNLGQIVLRIVAASFVLVLAGYAGTRVVGWLCRRAAFRGGQFAQAGMSMAAAAVAGWIWWRLLSGILLSPHAPAAIQDLVDAARQSWHFLLRFWHREVASGMTVRSLAWGILVFVFSFWLSRLLKRLFLQRVLARTPMDDSTRQTFAAILGYLLIVLGFLVGLNVAGSSLQNLALLAGAITVGVGFGLQNVINNFVSSLLIHFGRTIRVGDYIEAGGQRGIVQEIGLRNTRMLTDDGVTVLVPNGSFISANIINWTYPSPRTRLHVPVTILRQGNLAEATAILTEVALAHPLLVKVPKPGVEIRAVTASAITLDLLAWTDRPQQLASITGEISLEADRRLRQKGLLA